MTSEVLLGVVRGVVWLGWARLGQAVWHDRMSRDQGDLIIVGATGTVSAMPGAPR